MTDILVLGTDTGAGKTTFAVLWLTAYPEFGYWKPVETGESDTELVRRLVPTARVCEPFARFRDPVAPPLAARREGRSVPGAADVAAARPASGMPLLMESFGGPLSPFNDHELQAEFLRRMNVPGVIVSSSAVGAVGRTLATLTAARNERVPVSAVVLFGPPDDYATAEIRKHGDVPVISLQPPARWDLTAVRSAAATQGASLQAVRAAVLTPAPPSAPADVILRDDRRHVWHPYTSLRDPDPPLPVVSAQDEFLTLADGRHVIDGISSWWTILHGHRHPRLMAALHRASSELDHVLFAGVTHRYAVEYATELLKTAPWPGGRVFYSDNGSTAVEVALKMAYQWWCHRGEPQRTVFVGIHGAYHGDTFGAMAVGRDRLFFGRFEPLLFRAESVALSPDRLDDALKRLGPAAAGVIVEPLVQAAGGMRMHSPDTLRELFDVARRHGVPFIADEAMTCGRTGSFWAHSQAGIAPDLICAAKTLAGGILPLAVTLASPDVVAAFDVDDREKTFFHGHSFTAHPLACAVAVECLRLTAMLGHREQDRIRRFWEDVARSLGECREVRNVRVCGTVLALDVGDGTGYLAEAGRRMRRACIDSGVLLRPLGNVLYALPPWVTSDESLGRIGDAMRAAVRAAGS